MQRYLNNKSELEFFYLGLLLGKELGVCEEWQTKDAVGFGDFEGLHIHLCLHTLALDFDPAIGDESVKYFASVGVAHEARERVQEWLDSVADKGEQ